MLMAIAVLEDVTTLRFPLFRNRNFTRYLIAAGVTLLANALLQTALSLYMLDLTGSAGKFGLSLLVGQFPNLLLGLFAGAMADRLDRRRLMIQLAGVRAALLLVLSLYAFFQPVGEALIYALTLLLGLCQTLLGPAQVAMMPSIVTKEELVEANAIYGTSTESLLVAGPVLSALLYSAAGIRFSLLLCAALFALGGALLSFVQVLTPPGAGRRPSVLTDIGEVFDLFRRELRLTSLVFNGFLTHLFLMPLLMMGFPYIIKELFHGSNLDVGMVESAMTIGSVSSVVIVAALRKRVTVSQGILLGIIGMIVAVLPMGLLGSQGFIRLLAGRSLYVVLYFGAIAMLMFWVFGFYGVFYISFYQSTVPAVLLGRYFAVQSAAFGVARMLGYPLYGYLLDHQPLIIAILMLGAGMLAKLLVHLPFMRLDRQWRATASA
jgi:MFS family permease